MKFVAVALIATTVSAQTVCSDEDFADVCEEDACCGYLSPAEGDAQRVCSMGDRSAAADYEGDDIFSCDAPVVEEEGAQKVALGLSAIVAALYMAWVS